MKEVFNRKHEEALRKDPTLGTPLFDGEQRRPLPPPTIKVSDTQRNSFLQLRESGNLNAMQLRVLFYVKTRGPVACFEIAELMDTDDSNVSGRLTELRKDLGLIDFAPDPENKDKVLKRLNPNTNIRVNTYIAIPQ
jgi:hypothetical protein